MQIHVDRSPRVAVVRLNGDMRLWGRQEIADDIRDTLREIFAEGRDRVVMSLLGVDRIDSRGIGCLARCQAAAIGKRATLHLVVGPGMVKQALAPLNFARLYPIFGSVDEAMSAFGLERAGEGA